MSDNYRREVGKLKRRVGIGSEPEAFCPTCGSGLTRAGAAAVEARHREAGESARRTLLAYIEGVAERQRLANERARRSPDVPELTGADVRTDEDATERAAQFVEDDEVLKVIRRRREQRQQEREERKQLQPATETNNKGGVE